MLLYKSFLFYVRVPVRVMLHNDNSLESVILNDECDEDEVWLYWIDQNKEPHGKSIRSMSLGAKNNHKEDVDSMTYYRFRSLFNSYTVYNIKGLQFVIFKCIFRSGSNQQFTNKSKLLNFYSAL